jgi:uncharacterized membrane protein
MNTQGSIDAGVSGNYAFSIGGVLREAWDKTGGYKKTFVLAGLAYFGILLAVSFALGLLLGTLGGDPESVATAIVHQLVLAAVSLPLGIGLFMLGLKRSLDQPLAVSTIFNYYGKTLPLLLTLLLMYVMLAIGFLLLVIPGIYLAVAYYLALPLVVEKNLGPWAALETSRKAITRRWFAVFGLLLLLALINFIAVIPLGIGLIWSFPLTVITMGILYRNMFGCADAKPA